MNVISSDNRVLCGDLALAIVLALSLRPIYLLALRRAIDMADAIVALAEDVGARYLAVDGRYSAAIVPGLRPLLDPARAPDTPKLLRDDLSPYDGAKMVVYEIVVPGIQYLAPEDFPTSSSRMGPDEVRRKKGR